MWVFGLTQTCITGLLFLEPKDIRSISLGAIWSFSKASGLPWLDMRHKGPALRLRWIGAVRSQTLDILTHFCPHHEGTIQRWAARFTHRPLYPEEKASPVPPQNRELGGPKSQFRCFREERDVMALLGIKPRFVSCLACDLVSILTTTSWPR